MKSLLSFLVVAGALWSAGGLPLAADSYTIGLPSGFSMIANQLDNGGNTLDEVLPFVPTDTQLLKWNCTNQAYDSIIFSPDLGGWVDSSSGNPAGNVTLSPGEGAFFFNPSGAVGVTFVGTPHTPVFPPPMACGCGLTNLLSRQTNAPGTYENILGVSPVEGSQVSRFVGGTFIVYTFSGGVWAPSTPALGVGESAFFYTPCVTNTPPTILDTNQPASITVLQGRSHTLTVVAGGSLPLGYQWFFRQGVDPFQPIPGGTNSTYSITNMQLANAGSYYASVSNPAGSTNSPIAILGYAPDVEAPFIVSLNSITNRSIGLCFSEPVKLPSAIEPLNYIVNGGSVTVTNVALRPDGQSVELLLALPIGEFFSVTVTNVADVVGNQAADAKTGFVSPYASTTIGNPADPQPVGKVFTCFPESFEVTVGGSDIGGTSDHFHFIDQTVIGNFDLRAQVRRLDFAHPESKAGLMARESLAAGSRTLQTYFTPVQGSNQVQVSVRPTTGGPTHSSFQIGPNAAAAPLCWLRITRSNNVFSTYHSTNGVSWNVSGVTTQSFSTTLRVGMAVCSSTNGQPTTASFTDFRADGAQPGDNLVPAAAVALSTTNIQLNWQRTPRDYAVEVSTDLIEWSLLLLPIRQGPNPSDRSMVIPITPGYTQLFARLTRVARVIPVEQPAFFAPASSGSGVTPGIILSPENGLARTSYSGTFCGTSILSSTVFAPSATSIIIPVTTTRSIDTVPSDTSVNTVLQVRNASLATSCNDDAYGLGTKSRVKPLPGATSTTFKLLVAARANTSPGSIIRVYITY